jgi:excisionase family DNA binding protein
MMVRSVEVQAELLRAEEVAQLLGVGRSKVFEMIRSRELPMIRMGRSVRVPRTALLAWIEQSTQRPDSVGAWRLS